MRVVNEPSLLVIETLGNRRFGGRTSILEVSLKTTMKDGWIANIRLPAPRVPWWEFRTNRWRLALRRPDRLVIGSDIVRVISA
jgi:hypothetical protein